MRNLKKYLHFLFSICLMNFFGGYKLRIGYHIFEWALWGKGSFKANIISILTSKAEQLQIFTWLKCLLCMHGSHCWWGKQPVESALPQSFIEMLLPAFMRCHKKTEQSVFTRKTILWTSEVNKHLENYQLHNDVGTKT